MEFFEKAHVSKPKYAQRKDNKSEENVKKQLKQMLYGYHQNDNEIIQECAKVKNEYDDSSSVSGYSDLNLTNSCSEGDVTHETVGLDHQEANLRDKNTLDDSLHLSTDNADENSSHLPSIESISEYEEGLKSLSEDISPNELKELMESMSEGESMNSSFIETSTDIDSNSDDNEESESEFDANGALAAKILEKLSKNQTEKKKNSKKRKYEDDQNKSIDNKIETSDNFVNNQYRGPYRPTKDTDDDDDDKMDCLSLDMSNISLPDTQQYSGPYRPKEQGSDIDSVTVETTSNDNNNSQDGSAEEHSIEHFVSVLANDMESQSLTDILGEYRHPTIRNLPSDTQNVFTHDDAKLFETEDVSVVDIQTEDDEVDSLIPEVDNVPAVEDIELEMVDLNTSTEPLEESTTYGDAVDTTTTFERESSTESIDHKLNSPNPVKFFYGKNNHCIFILSHPVQMYIHGKVKVKCLGGCVEIMGYTLNDEIHTVYAPNYNYAQYIKTIENQNPYYGLFGKLTSEGISVSEAEDIVTSIGEYDGIICLQPLRSRQMDFVENNSSATDLFSKPSKNIDNFFKKASELLGCSLYLSRPWRSFEENAIWQQAITIGLNKQSRGIVCGSKGVGKSTFLRYYVNKLLAKSPVLVIDLDPGQCEFNVAGNVSATVVTAPLLGPNFTHLKTPEMMLNLGMINTMDNPKRYAAAVNTLITHCSTDDRLKDLPWIINTMGMTNTVGLKLISLIILLSKPTFLLQIDSINVKKRYDFHLYPQTVKNLYFEDYQTDNLFESVEEVDLDYAFLLSNQSDIGVKNNFSLAPRDERYLNFLAYFGQLLDIRSGDLLSIVPYEVNLKDLKIGLNVKVHVNAITKVINGKVVALCQSLQDTDQVFTLPDMPLRCHGAGLIRGIDWEKEVLYIITPCAAERLAVVDCLVYADWVPELRGPDFVRLPAGEPLPYRTATSYNQRQFLFPPKRRFNPLQLLKMSRSA